MLRLQIGICVATFLVIVMGLTRLHRGAILWAGVLFFAFALVSVAWLKDIWVIKHLGVLASGTLFVITLLSVFVGRPFTEDYAREHVPRELWDSPAFIRSCYTVTSLWGFIFLANTLVNFAKLYYPETRELFFQGLEFGFVILGVAFTTAYSQHARRKRLASSAAETIRRSPVVPGKNQGEASGPTPEKVRVKRSIDSSDSFVA